MVIIYLVTVVTLVLVSYIITLIIIIELHYPVVVNFIINIGVKVNLLNSIEFVHFLLVIILKQVKNLLYKKEDMAVFFVSGLKQISVVPYYFTDIIYG